MNHTMQIGKRTISAASPTFIVAEVSANHNQNYDRAVEIIHAAAEAGADAVKLQTYTADTLTIDCHDDCFMNKGGLWDGISEYDLYKQAYTPWEWQPKLIEEAHKLGMECFSSPFDFTAVDFLEELNVPAYKIASYEINDIPLIRKVAKLHKPVIFATGIAYPEDIERAFAVCKEEGNEDVILLKCVSAYPTPYEEVNLNVIPTLAKTYDCLTGISDHTLGTIVSAGAVPLGAKMVEKHLTLRRADGGPDSGFSMEPQEFKQMVDSIRNVEKALGKVSYELSDKMKANREFSRSLFAVKDIKKGEIITKDNVKSIRPGFGLHPKYLAEIIGCKAAEDIDRGTPFKLEFVNK